MEALQLDLKRSV